MHSSKFDVVELICTDKNPFVDYPFIDNIELYKDLITTVQNSIREKQNEVIAFCDMMGYDIDDLTEMVANNKSSLVFDGTYEQCRDFLSIAKAYNFMVHCIDGLSPEDTITMSLADFPEL